MDALELAGYEGGKTILYDGRTESLSTIRLR